MAPNITYNYNPPKILSSKASTSQSLDEPPDEGHKWLCSHYKRRCEVKFECCERFWPCHRCHNSQSPCGQKKLSREAQWLKCECCEKVQQFAATCCNCGVEFAVYCCPICKHLTGKDEDPYHCAKCGICRIDEHRSFHCDICGVCLEKEFLGNHKCREGSAHDPCEFCLQDTFTGCQILPCSHKVHKECTTQMIRSGIATKSPATTCFSCHQNCRTNGFVCDIFTTCFHFPSIEEITRCPVCHETFT